MKKNYFKKVVSVFAATTVLAMATSAMPASAADEKLNLVIPEVKTTLDAGETVEVKVAFAGDNEELKVDSIGLMLTYSEKLELINYSSTIFQKKEFTHSGNKLMFATGGDELYGTKNDEGEFQEIVTLVFAMPKEAGKYDISWVNFPNKNFYNVSVNQSEMVPHDLVDGFIEVEGAAPVTTVPVTTAPVTTVTTTAPVTTVTTTAPVTTVTTTAVETTPATTPTTTVAETTPAVSTTKDPKDTAKSSPSTGTRSNGVAALAGTMLVAASAAVVLKKKKD